MVKVNTVCSSAVILFDSRPWTSTILLSLPLCHQYCIPAGSFTYIAASFSSTYNAKCFSAEHKLVYPTL